MEFFLEYYKLTYRPSYGRIHGSLLVSFGSFYVRKNAISRSQNISDNDFQFLYVLISVRQSSSFKIFRV